MIARAKIKIPLAAATVAIAAALSGCGELTSAANFNFADPFAGVPKIERAEKDGSVELVLYPVAVWDEKGATEPVRVDVGGENVYLRKAQRSPLARPWVKMGLLWNSRGDGVYVPVVVFGPPADIYGLEFAGEGGREKLEKARNVSFEPGGDDFWGGGRRQSSAVFRIGANALESFLASPLSRVVVRTNRGALILDLGALGGDTEAATRANAKVMFSRFVRQMRGGEEAAASS